MRYRNRTRLFRPRLAFAVLLAVALAPAAAQEVRLLVQRSLLAGFRYYEAPALFDRHKPPCAVSRTSGARLCVDGATGEGTS